MRNGKLMINVINQIPVSKRSTKFEPYLFAVFQTNSTYSLISNIVQTQKIADAFTYGRINLKQSKTSRCQNDIQMPIQEYFVQ